MLDFFVNIWYYIISINLPLVYGRAVDKELAVKRKKKGRLENG